jgi:glycine oxidase
MNGGQTAVLYLKRQLSKKHMTDCIIVGGGLIGMLTARELHQAGADVLVIDKGRLGGESTWAGGGILSPLYPWRYGEAVNALARYSQRVYQDIAEQLYRESGVDPEYTPSGLLVLDSVQHPSAEAWARRWDMPLQWLDAQALSAFEPALCPAFEQGLLLPSIAQLRNPRLARALRGSLEYRGIACYENTEVTGMSIANNRIVGVTTSAKDFRADKVIIAGGAWSANIVRHYAEAPRIEPVKGQMIIFRGEPDLLKHIVLYKDRYVIPRRDGRVLAGSTLEYTGFDKQTTEEALQQLKAAAIDMVPALVELTVEHHWSGLRPGAPSGIPYICAHPEINGLYINSGHFRNGVVLGAASSRLMRDLVLGRSPDIAADPYALTASR